MGLLPAVVAIPVLASLVGLLAARSRSAARAVSVGGVAIALVLAAYALLTRSDHPPLVSTLPAINTGDLRIPLQLQGTGPALLIGAVAALVGLAVQVYSTIYLADDDRYAVFAATVSLFTAAMLLVVLSADLILTLVGWEVMGWCSYLLIGHWSRREGPRRAAHKAFIVTRIADIGFVLGVVILAAGPGSTAYGRVLTYWIGTNGGWVGAPPAHPSSPPLLSLALVLLVIGVLGKSAQIPFQDWLPDAMEGPTPASALIHAATMVAAGTFVLAQLFPILVLSTPARMLLAISTAVTMVLGAITAFGQSDLKRLLAWSTVSQVAVMLSALASAPIDKGSAAGVLHLYAHAFFKALLFLTIAWLGTLAGGTSARALRGVARRSRLLRVAFLGGLLALAGLPFVVGGVSKEAVIAAARDGAEAGDPAAWVVFVSLLLTVVLTAAYAARAYVVVSLPDRVAQSADDAPAPAPPVLPVAVSAVLVVLLGGTVLGGLVLLTDLLGVGGGVDVPLMVVTVGLALVGALLAWRLSSTHSIRRSQVSRVDPAPRLLGDRMALFDNGFGIDRVYRLLVAVPVVALARSVAAADDSVVDATGRAAARGVTWLGRTGSSGHDAERPATGLVWVGAAVVALGTLGVLAWR
ncbi:MAG: proton-conducting transporter membrane subunit [Nostocoides sp.]